MMKRTLITLLALMLLTPLACPQQFKANSELSRGRKTMRLTSMMPGMTPQAIIDMVGAPQQNKLTMRQVGIQRIDDVTTSVVYATSYSYLTYGEEITKNWVSTFTYNTEVDSVTIEGFLDGMFSSGCDVITAPYKDGVITIPADPDLSTNNYTVIGVYGGYYNCYLFGGDLSDDGSTAAMDTEVILYVADDLSTVDNGGKVIGMWMEYFGSVYPVAYSETGLVWERLQEGTANNINTSELNFGELMYPKTSTLTFDIQTYGSEKVNYSVTSDDSHFTVSPTEGSIDLLGVQTFSVSFKPGEIGEFKGNLTIMAGDSTYTVVCTGTGIDIPRDFSDLVTKGDPTRFTWENDETYPWTITDGVASYGNVNVPFSDSNLTGVLSCPSATRITFDWALNCYGQDTLFVLVDGHRVETLLSDNYSTSGTCSFMVSSGIHAITWNAHNGINSWTTNNISISNVQLDEAQEFELVSPDSSVDDFAMTDAANYNGTIYRTAQDGTFTINVAPNGAAAVSFDVTAGESYPVTIAIDGVIDRNITANETYYHNFTEGGSHSIVATLGGFDAGISEVYVNDGEYTCVTKTYLVNGQSYLNENGALDLVNGVKLCYPVNVTTTSTGKVYFDNLVENDNVTKPCTISGQLHNGKITIATSTRLVEGTLYGLDDNSEDGLVDYGYYNNRYWLEAGTLSSLESSEFDKGWVEELTLTCNDDMSRIKANTGFGIWKTWSWWYDSGIVEFLKPEATFYETTTGKVKTIAEVDALDFGTIYANSSIATQSVMILNLGDSTDFEAYIEGDNKAMFTVTPTTGSMAAHSGQLFTVSYTPTRTGSHTATLVIVTEGEDERVSLTGNAIDMPDYNEIVTEGEECIRGWNTSSDYPWYVEDGVAYSGNKGVHNSTSKLTADIVVPEGYYARVSANVKGFPEYYDGVYVTLDDETIESFNVLVEYGEFGRVVDEGEHTLSIWLTKSAGDTFLSDDQAQITNLRIRLYAKGSDVAMTEMPKYNFEQLVPWDLGDSIQVTLVNRGTNSLKVNSVTTAEPFTVDPIADVAAGESGTFTVHMSPCEVGIHTATIVLHTSAGDVEFEVEGTADYVRYLGNFNAGAPIAPISTYYNKWYVDQHYCESVYEADWLQGLKGAKFTDMTFFTYTFGRIDLQSKSVSWNVTEIDSPNEVPMDNDNPIPSGLTNVYEGEQIDIEGYELTIPFAEPYEYQGGNFMYFAEQLAYEPFEYGFYWRSEGILTESGTDDTSSKVTGVWVSYFNWQNSNYRPIMRIRYIPADDPSGVNELNAEEMQTVEGDGYTYDLMGRRVNPDNLAPGIYIRNGQKFMVK